MPYNMYPQYYNYQQQFNNSQPMQQPQQPQIQNGGFVSVRSEMEARNYPVAPGNSVTFKDETAPYVYTKTMGFSQLDTPLFDKYRLVKEDVETPSEQPTDSRLEAIEQMQDEINRLWSAIDVLKEQRKATAKKKEVVDNE